MNTVKMCGCVLSVVGLFAIAGCNQAKSPETVQKDVTKAEESGAKEVIKAEAKEANTDAKQDSNAVAAVGSADSKEMNAAVDTALAQADADKKLALAK